VKAGPHALYFFFNRTLFSHGNVTEADLTPSRED
jgi:hypothetical protein